MRPDPSGLDLAGRRVLVADDDASVRELLFDFLVHLGAEVEECGDGREAVERLRTQSWDALITDLRMPGLDGITLIGVARELDPALPIVVMTGFASFESALNAVRAGAHDYLRKPFDLGEVERALGAALSLRRASALDPELGAGLVIEIERPLGADPAARDALVGLAHRLAARAWSRAARDLTGAGLIVGAERALEAAPEGAASARVRIDAAALTIAFDGADAPAFRFERPDGRALRAA